MKKLISILFVISFPFQVQAGAPTCHSSHGGYCAYKGKVNNLYINSGDLILIYFDTPANSAIYANASIEASSKVAAAYDGKENPQFAAMLYSTALAAQQNDKTITIQMRGNIGGYSKIDRIWIAP